jgi:hypothetical protein
MALLDDIVRTGAGTVYRFILGIAEIHVGLLCAQAAYLQ